MMDNKNGSISHMSSNRRQAIQMLGLVSVSTLISTSALAATLKERFRPRGSAGFDHALWDALLQRYVQQRADGLNVVDYTSFKANDRVALARYLKNLQAATPSRFSALEAFAYWINLYNAKTIDVVLSHYPVKSIKDINLGGGFFGSGPWKKNIVDVEGQGLSLDNIEHDILRPIFRDARIHYAVNCASYSCPNLTSRAYTAQNINSLLNKGAHDYINNKRGVRIRNNNIIASKIYSWYSKDFGGKKKLKSHWLQYATKDKAKMIESATKIAGYEYNWSLNDAR